MAYAMVACTTAMIVMGIADAILVFKYGVAGSMSRWIQYTGYRSPWFCLMIGFLLGHWFGYMPPPDLRGGFESPEPIEGFVLVEIMAAVACIIAGYQLITNARKRD